MQLGLAETDAVEIDQAAGRIVVAREHNWNQQPDGVLRQQEHAGMNNCAEWN